MVEGIHLPRSRVVRHCRVGTQGVRHRRSAGRRCLRVLLRLRGLWGYRNWRVGLRREGRRRESGFLKLGGFSMNVDDGRDEFAYEIDHESWMHFL